MKKIPQNFEDWANYFVNSLPTLLDTGKPVTPEPLVEDDAACIIFDRVFSQSGTGRSSVMVAFECSLQELPTGPDREDRLRDIAKVAALSTARSHGNIIETGRTLLGSIDELGARLSLDVRRCKDQVMLGLAEGACQVGPIVYGRFLDIASEYRDNADDWIAKNKRRVSVFESSALPVIVPFEAELTLSARPFKEPLAPNAEKAEAVEVARALPIIAEQTERGEATTQPQDLDTETSHTQPAEETSELARWSRPQGKGFFQRLSDVMGSLFGRK